MSIWLVVYLFVFVLLSAASLLDDARDGRRWPHLAVGLIAHLAGILLVMSYGLSSLASALGAGALALLALVLTWDGWANLKAVHTIVTDVTLPREQASDEVVGVLTMLAARVPAYLCGLALLVR